MSHLCVVPHWDSELGGGVVFYDMLCATSIYMYSMATAAPITLSQLCGLFLNFNPVLTCCIPMLWKVLFISKGEAYK